MMTTIQMTIPSSGCDVCGGPVRTRKRNLGWVCSKCAPSEWRKLGIPVTERH